MSRLKPKLSSQRDPRTTTKVGLAPTALPAASKTELLNCLRRRFNQREVDKIMVAAEFAAMAHDGQLRDNGDPYITHPVKVAEMVSDWQLDQDAIVAALLHDVIEDTDYTFNDIEERFSDAVAEIVNGVSKIEQIEQIEQQPSNDAKGNDALGTLKASASFRKLILAVSRDWRVILIKLADRVHNMRTLGNIKSRAKRRRIAQETLDIYAPIAERLGYMETCGELQCLSFEHINQMRYAVLTAAMERSRLQSRKTIPAIKRSISSAMKKANIKITIEAREKNVYSVYRKMIEKRLSFSEVDDIIGFRLIVESRADCYLALGVIHDIFRPIPEKLKDYIGLPKANGYQSIHTTVLSKNGGIVELQLRTLEMHRYAEYGMAAHWNYKDMALLPSVKSQNAPRKMQAHTNQLLSNLMSLSSQGLEAGEFLRNMRLDLFPNEVMVLTPKGKVIELVKGATALDMAYQVHTDLGDSANSAIINGQRMPISATLNSGDIIEIVTSPNTHPNPQWLSFVVTTKARSHLRSKLKQDYSETVTELGRNLLDRSLRRSGYNIELLGDDTINKFLGSLHHLNSEEDLYTEIALGKLSPDIISNELLGPHRHEQSQQKELSISIAGDKRAGITRASCCEPLPPEPIVGVMEKNRGLFIHRNDCPEVAKQVRSNQHIQLHWNSASKDSTYKVNLTLECNNRSGLLADVMGKFASVGVNIVSINLGGAEGSNPVATIAVEMEVKDALQIESLLRRLNTVKGVSVTRAGATTQAKSLPPKPSQQT